MDSIEERWPPVDLTDARVQDGFRQSLAARTAAVAGGARAAGWKVAWNDPAVRRWLRVQGGAVGYLLESTLFDAEQALSLTGTLRPGAELELAFHLRADVHASALDAEILAAVGAVSAAIELIDLDEERFRDVTWALAHNCWHRGAVLGPAHAWSSGLLQGLTIEAQHNGEPAAGPLTRVDELSDPTGAIRFVAATLEALGESLRAGDVILSGLLAPQPLWLTPGDRLETNYGALGQISLTFV